MSVFKWWWAGPTALALSGLAASAQAGCPIERARYRLDHQPEFSAGFHSIGRHKGWPSDLALFVHSERTRKTYWFLFDRGASVYISLISTTDVLAHGWVPPSPDGGPRPFVDTNYMAADRTYSFLTRVPEQGEARPEYLLLPDLPEILGHVADPPEAVGLNFFKFDRCAPLGAAPRQAAFARNQR